MKPVKTFNEAIRRLERLESRIDKKLAISEEKEDLTETDLELYGNEVIKEIYQIYGADHLKAMLESPTLSGESKIIIADFLCRIDETPWRN